MATYEDLVKQGYKESDAVKGYRTQLDNAIASKPGDYTSAYTAQLDNLYNQLSTRKPFTYDVNSDALYQQYKNQYLGLGKQAMKDTMGQAAGLTGGYGSTYSQRAGQQAYQQYLSQLNDKVPELAQVARQNYDAETDRMRQLYDLTNGRENQDYSRYQDTVSRWQSDVNMYNSLFSNERTFDYGQWSDAVAQAQWQKQFDENVRQFELNYAKAGSGGGGGYGYGGDSGYNYNGTDLNYVTLPNGSTYKVGTTAANRPQEGQSNLTKTQLSQIYQSVNNMVSANMNRNQILNAIDSGGGYFSSSAARDEAKRYLNGK